MKSNAARDARGGTEPIEYPKQLSASKESRCAKNLKTRRVHVMRSALGSENNSEDLFPVDWPKLFALVQTRQKATSAAKTAKSLGLRCDFALSSVFPLNSDLTDVFIFEKRCRT